jgi:ComF family protein
MVDVERLRVVVACPQCAAPTDGLCGVCIKQPPAFDCTVAALCYLPPLTMLVQYFKFYGSWQLAELLASFAVAPAADVMLPVPLHPTRESWRGFNQARELAKMLPSPAPPLRDDWLRRVVDTLPQTRQTNVAARRRNVKGAFTVAAAVRGRRVLVVDDVMSSGATMQEIAKVLKKAGAAKVINLIIARTVPKKSTL